MGGEAPFRDFDAAWAERAREAPRFKAFGREFVLPGSPPVKLMLIAARAAEQDPTQNMAPEQILEIAGLLVGRDTVKELLDEGVEFDQLGDVIKWAQDTYRSRGGDDDDGPPPKEDGGSSAPSSPTGGPSKLTSPGSTDWIS